MVGDFQQSIYRDRADLMQYRRIHNALVETNAAQELELSVTFRLDTAQLELVNDTFSQILNNSDNQVAFVQLNPRPQILPGQVVRLKLSDGNLEPDARGKISETRRAAEEARQLALWLRAAGLNRLRAESWSNVAILCPRKEWLQTLRRGLRNAGFTVQIQSEKEVKGDSPAYAWLTALFMIMSQPRCAYQIVGVLRELFGLSDHDLALFSWGHGDRFQIETVTSGVDVVSRHLTLLAQARLSILELPLFDAANQLIRQTQLRERLRSLPREDFENLENELDALLALAAACESDRMTMSEFSERLRLHFLDPREVRPSSSDAIQLITSQKAKGSEWQAVIVPFLARQIRSASPRYPQIFKDRETGNTRLLWDNADRAEVEDLIDREARQDMERLLYVALTRAQHTLIVAFDEELFAKTNGEIHEESQLKWLQAEQGRRNDTAFTRVAAEAVECAFTSQHQEQRRRKKFDELEDRLIAGKVDGTIAAKNASGFVSKFTPSGLLADEVSATLAGEEVFRPAAKRGPALRYGLWWHDFARDLPWSLLRPGEMAPAGQEIFKCWQIKSPEPKRSEKEWKLLGRHLASDQSFLRSFCAPRLIAHAEMPFFWKAAIDRCLEGVIDLALFDATARRWLILDWKTNEIDSAELDKLRNRYRAQIAAYWKTISQLTEQPVSAAIYSTATGNLVVYDASELGAEWERLSAVGADQFAAEINRDEVNQSSEPLGQLEFGDW